MMGHDPCKKNSVQRGIPCCSGKKVSAFVVRSVVCVVVCGCVCCDGDCGHGVVHG